MNYHARMVNIQVDEGACIDAADRPGMMKAYRTGHRDARHVAAEIANEADREIADLTDNNTTLRVRVKELSEHLSEAVETLEKVADERDALSKRVDELVERLDGATVGEVERLKYQITLLKAERDEARRNGRLW